MQSTLASKCINAYSVISLRRTAAVVFLPPPSSAVHPLRRLYHRRSSQLEGSRSGVWFYKHLNGFLSSDNSNSCPRPSQRTDGESTQRQKPSKNCIRFEIREKRADAKKALKGLLFGDRFQEYIPNIKDNADKKNSRFKSSPRQTHKAHHKRIKRKLRRECFSDDECPELFHATFGNKSYTWSFKSWEEIRSRNINNEFEWKEYSSWTDDRYSKWQNPSDIEYSDDESCSVGLSSDRRLLGLPSEGPLKIEDVKNAFRLSALKWHPDKHQGPSQETAEEKFKLCVTAYKSLCGVLSSN